MKRKQNGKHKPACQCAICARVAGGMTRQAAMRDVMTHMQEQMAKHGWIAHFVTQDPSSPTGFNAHTHGLAENNQHPDFQIVLPMPPDLAHDLLRIMAERVKEGEKFQADQKVAEVIGGLGKLDGRELLVKLIDATEGDRPVLRMVLPDKDGNLDLGQIADPFAAQYDMRGASAAL